MPVAFASTTRALDADRGLVSRRALVVGLVLLAAWTAWFSLARITLYEVSRSARLEVTGAAHVIAASGGGRLVALHVRPGQRVRAGEVIAELDTAPARLRLAEAEARLAAYPARIAASEAQLAAARSAGREGTRAARAEAAAAEARSHAIDDDARFRNGLARRRAGDAADGTASASDAERSASEARQRTAESAAARSEAERARAEGSIRTAERAEGRAGLSAKLADLRAEAAAARADVEALRLTLDRQVLRAPADGTVGDVTPLREGEELAAGARVATLVPSGELEVIATFDGAGALGRVVVGQAARMRLDGRDWTRFGELGGHVAAVGAEPGDGALRVELQVASHDGRLQPRHGMTGAVEVAVEQVSPATLVLRAIGKALA